MYAAALLLLSAAPAPADRELLNAFRTVCEKVTTLDGMKAAALSSGWSEVPASEDPRVERLTRLGIEAIGADALGTGINFRRTLAGRTLFLIASRYEDKSGYWGNGCRLYHFEASSPLADADLIGWMGRKPTGIQDVGKKIARKLLWEPGWRDGVTVEISHVPPESPLQERFGLRGNILVAQAIGGF